MKLHYIKEQQLNHCTSTNFLCRGVNKTKSNNKRKRVTPTVYFLLDLNCTLTSDGETHLTALQKNVTSQNQSCAFDRVESRFGLPDNCAPWPYVIGHPVIRDMTGAQLCPDLEAGNWIIVDRQC